MLIKRIIAIFLIVVYCHLTMAQSLKPSVLSPSGTSYMNGSNNLDFTIGEVTTNTLSGNQVILSEGFQQPDLIITSVKNYDSDYSISIYPNPTCDILMLDFINLSRTILVELKSTEGKMLLSNQTSSNGILNVDMSKYSSGMYFISIIEASGKTKTFQVIKK